MSEKAEKGLVFPLFRPLPPQKQSFYPIFFAGNKKSSNFGGEISIDQPYCLTNHSLLTRRIADDTTEANKQGAEV
ncbi:MAG: hypothetical protein IJV33_03190 [Bacteroidaceae bacterium]|nr:hypothetical protein [Bacteroidaceae bacterium]